jgi:hypothetical protein
MVESRKKILAKARAIWWVGRGWGILRGFGFGWRNGMADLDVGHEEEVGVVRRNARVGMVLFLMYAGMFGGFLYMNIFLPEVMAGTVVPLPGERELTLYGVNLAVVYGMGLIVGAFVLAIYYMRLVRRRG